jgi:hypothetical protein
MLFPSKTLKNEDRRRGKFAVINHDDKKIVSLLH